MELSSIITYSILGGVAFIILLCLCYPIIKSCIKCCAEECCETATVLPEEDIEKNMKQKKTQSTEYESGSERIFRLSTILHSK
jgi:hypothetical protein